jgi:hypothetical protein
MTVFTNSVLLGALSVFYPLFRNILWIAKNRRSIFEGLENEFFGRKILALLSGYKTNISTLRKGHSYPLEDVEENDEGIKKRKLLVFPKDANKEEIVAKIVENVENERLDDEIWATPGLPLLIFITAGLIIALTYGDIVWILTSSLIR